jgi:hypothetical protein
VQGTEKSSATRCHSVRSKLAFVAVEHVADGFAAGGVQFGVAAGEVAFIVVFFLGLAAGGAAVGEAGLVGAQLEFFSTDGAGADGEWHDSSYDKSTGGEGKSVFSFH